MLAKILETFCNHTNLHGFSYIFQKSRNKIEKIFWIISILCSFILTGILIQKLIIERQRNSIVIYTDQNPIKVQDLNFPAVAMCLGVLGRTPCQTHMYYDGAKVLLEKNKTAVEELNETQLKLLQIGSLLSRDRFMSNNFPEFNISTSNFLDLLAIFRRFFFDQSTHLYSFYGVLYDQFKIEATEEFFNTGPCYTFNIPSFRNVFEELKNLSTFTHKTSQTLFSEKSWKYQFPPSIPVKAQSPGKGLFIKFWTFHYCQPERKAYNFFRNSLQQSELDGLVLRFHDPYEVLSNDAPKFYLIRDKMVTLSIVPKIIRIDDSLLDVEIDVRNCYLPNEHQLEFFKVYTKVNCEHECLTQMTINKCGCAQFYMIKTNPTRICGVADEKCFRNVEDEFEDSKLSCNCLEPCNYVKYEVELKNVEQYFEMDTRNNDCMAAQIEFASDKFFGLIRKKSQTTLEFFSFVGGILNLFAGFSVLSGVEIIYFFLIFPCIEMREKKKVRPTAAKKQRNKLEINKRNLMRFFMKMLEGSSIHSFSQIGRDGKRPFERVIWLILFIMSMTSSYLVAQKVYKTFKEAKIIMRMEGSPTNLEDIPFPAFTIVRDLELTFRNWNEKIPGVEFKGYEYIYTLHYEFQNLICSRYMRRWDNGVIYPTDFLNSTDIVNVIRYYTVRQPKWFHTRNVTWNCNVDPPFAEVLTSTLFGYTFNLIEHSKLLHEDLVSGDFNYTYNSNKSLNFPWKTSTGSKKGFNFEVDVKYKFINRTVDQRCFERETIIIMDFNTGIKMYVIPVFNTGIAYILIPVLKSLIIIHPPNELPIRHQQVSSTRASSYDILVTPEIVKFDENLRGIELGVRNCYFDDERKLKYFKIYTQTNCELECASYVVYDKCGCVPYNFIRNSTMLVCDYYRQTYCVKNMKQLMNLTTYDNLLISNNVCICLPQCNYVKYSYTIYQSRFKKGIDEENVHVTINWKDSEYYAIVRSQQLRLVDFFSYLSGIWGLFAGISVLSIVELFYFLTIRLINDLVRFFRQ